MMRFIPMIPIVAGLGTITTSNSNVRPATFCNQERRGDTILVSCNFRTGTPTAALASIDPNPKICMKRLPGPTLMIGVGSSTKITPMDTFYLQVSKKHGNKIYFGKMVKTARSTKSGTRFYTTGEISGPLQGSGAFKAGEELDFFFSYPICDEDKKK